MYVNVHIPLDLPDVCVCSVYIAKKRSHGWRANIRLGTDIRHRQNTITRFLSHDIFTLYGIPIYDMATIRRQTDGRTKRVHDNDDGGDVDNAEPENYNEK